MKASAHKTLVRHGQDLFPVIVQEDVSGTFWVSCPTLEGCYSQGDTVDEALKNMREAIALCLEDLPRTHQNVEPANVSLHFIRL